MVSASVEIENGLANRIHFDSIVTTYSVMERMKTHKVPGISIAVVSNGGIHWSKGYGIANSSTLDSINTETLFQAASISKPLTALAILKLYEEGQIELDDNINTYLKRWQIPENEFTKKEKVTIRRILNHTAGLSVHGFPGYVSNEPLPELESVIKGEGNTGPVIVKKTPGQEWRYSGGGYLLLQMLIEDITGQSFESYMKDSILLPMGMSNSTFSQPINSNHNDNRSAAFDSDGKMLKGLWRNYPEMAAAGLWTTPTDLAKYCIEIQEIAAGKKNGILKKRTIDMMLTKHDNDWGLGPSLVSEGNSLRFVHGGKNEGFTTNLIAFAHKGEAVVIMTNGDNGRKVITELERSVSTYYGWGMNNYRIVHPVTLPPNSTSNLIGNYLDIEGNENATVEISLKNDTLFVTDTNFNIHAALTPLNELNFVSISKQIEISFEKDKLGEVKGFLWNNKWKHVKIKD